VLALQTGGYGKLAYGETTSYQISEVWFGPKNKHLTFEIVFFLVFEYYTTDSKD